MADTSEGASTEGSDTVTISISSSWPATGTDYNISTCEIDYGVNVPTDRLFYCNEDRVIQGVGECSEKKEDSSKDTPSALWFGGLLLQIQLVLVSVVS